MVARERSKLSVVEGILSIHQLGPGIKGLGRTMQAPPSLEEGKWDNSTENLIDSYPAQRIRLVMKVGVPNSLMRMRWFVKNSGPDPIKCRLGGKA